MAKRKTQAGFIQDAIKIHGNHYDYSRICYVNSHTHIEIICPIHGSFYQAPNHHLKGHGCQYCKNNNRIKSTDQFIRDAIAVHGDMYDYSDTHYTHNARQIKIGCSVHGVFLQIANDHLKGSGCSECSINRISIPEKQWLDQIGVPDDEEHRQVSLNFNNSPRRKVDGYDPATNTIYEFYGDYWHGNPNTTDHSKINPTNKKSFKTLYENTIKKEELIRKLGYNLITMWESDWKTHV